MPAKRFTHNEQFTSDNVAFAGKSISGVAVASEIKAVDLLLTADHCLTGCLVLVHGAKIGDTTSLQIVHPTYGVVNTFATDWFMSSDRENQFILDLSYPANLAAGLTIRALYKATAEAGSRTIMINYLLHRVVEQA